MKIKLGINWTRSAIALALLCAVFSFTAMAQENSNKPLDAAAASALRQELIDGLPDLIDDEDAVADITEKWEARRDLVGKTRDQALRLLFADVRSIITEKETQNAVWAKWNAEEEEGDDEEEEVAVKPTPRIVPPVKPTPVKPTPGRPTAEKADDEEEEGDDEEEEVAVKPTPRIVPPVKPTPVKPIPGRPTAEKADDEEEEGDDEEEEVAVKPNPRIVPPVKPMPVKPTAQKADDEEEEGDDEEEEVAVKPTPAKPTPAKPTPVRPTAQKADDEDEVGTADDGDDAEDESAPNKITPAPTVKNGEAGTNVGTTKVPVPPQALIVSPTPASATDGLEEVEVAWQGKTKGRATIRIPSRQYTARVFDEKNRPMSGLTVVITASNPSVPLEQMKKLVPGYDSKDPGWITRIGDVARYGNRTLQTANDGSISFSMVDDVEYRLDVRNLNDNFSRETVKIFLPKSMESEEYKKTGYFRLAGLTPEATAASAEADEAAVVADEAEEEATSARIAEQDMKQLTEAVRPLLGVADDDWTGVVNGFSNEIDVYPFFNATTILLPFHKLPALDKARSLLTLLKISARPNLVPQLRSLYQSTLSAQRDNTPITVSVPSLRPPHAIYEAQSPGLWPPRIITVPFNVPYDKAVFERCQNNRKNYEAAIDDLKRCDESLNGVVPYQYRWKTTVFNHCLTDPNLIPIAAKWEMGNGGRTAGFDANKKICDALTAIAMAKDMTEQGYPAEYIARGLSREPTEDLDIADGKDYSSGNLTGRLNTFNIEGKKVISSDIGEINKILRSPLGKSLTEIKREPGETDESYKARIIGRLHSVIEPLSGNPLDETVVAYRFGHETTWDIAETIGGMMRSGHVQLATHYEAGTYRRIDTWWKVAVAKLPNQSMDTRSIGIAIYGWPLADDRYSERFSMHMVMTRWVIFNANTGEVYARSKDIDPMRDRRPWDEVRNGDCPDAPVRIGWVTESMGKGYAPIAGEYGKIRAIKDQPNVDQGPVDMFRENVFRQDHVVSGKRLEIGSWVKYSVCQAPREDSYSWAVRIVAIDPPPGKTQK